MTVKRILVVDDSAVIRTIVVETLRSRGYEALEAASGEAAIEACERNYFDLAIIDYKMSGMSGLETAELIHTQYNVPFMFLTSSEDTRVMEKAVEHGAQSYLLKPVKPPEVLAQVHAALSRSAETRNLSRALTETRLINVAIGILMVQHRLTREAALTKLRNLCRPQRRKAHEAAEQIVSAFEAMVKANDAFEQVAEPQPAKSR